MIDANAGPAQPNVVNPHSKEIDKIVEGGWSVVIEHVRMTTTRLIELAANIYAHRKPAMTMPEWRDSGLLSLNLHTHIDDFVNLVSGFRPPKRSALRLDQPEFSSPFDSVRDEFPSAELLDRHIKAIDLALFLTAVEIMVERPGVPVPTFEQLASAYIELARLRSIETVVETAASVDLSGGASADVDLFGVGPSVAMIVNRIIPPRCVPGEGKVTLPRRPTIDDVVAANLLERYVVKGGYIYFESQMEDTFDAAATHTTNHATVGAGSTPFHSPQQLCFDRRALKQPVTNTELVIAHAIEMGTPLDFTDPMVRFAEGDKLDEYQFETEMINTFLEACGSTSLAMNSAKLLIESRFKPSETFRAWCQERSREYIKSLPGYQKYEPKLKQALMPLPGLQG